MFDSFNEVEIRALLKEDGFVFGMNLSVSCDLNFIFNSLWEVDNRTAIRSLEYEKLKLKGPISQCSTRCVALLEQNLK